MQGGLAENGGRKMTGKEYTQLAMRTNDVKPVILYI